MPLQPIPFAAQSYEDRSLSVNAQRLVNMYLEEKPEGSKSRVALHGTPGTKLFGTAGDGPCRGMSVMGEYLWSVSGNNLYRVDKFGASTAIGAVSGSKLVSMTHNGTQLVISSDSDAYYYDSSTGTFALLSLNDLAGVTFHDGYIIMLEKNSQKFFITGLNDVTSIDATEFALVNALPDNNIGIENANRETWIFEEKSIQVYYNSGAADFPFTRVASGVIERGCKSGRTIAEYDGTLYWLGDDLRVYQSRGIGFVPISTPPIEREILTYSGVSDSSAFIYGDEGHIFYILTFPEATWAYDVSTGLWHERQTDGRSDWRVRTYARFNDKHIVGDVADGSLYQLDLDTYDEDGGVLRRIMTSPPIHANGSRVTMKSLVVDFEAGVGLATGQGSEAEVMLDYSDDGGRTWSSEQWRSIGKVGEYRRRAKWTRLGQFRSRILRLTISDPIKITAIEALADLEVRMQ